SVPDLARQFSRGANDQLLSRGELALETPSDFSDVDTGLAHEDSVLGNLDDATVHRGLHATFDHQRVAVGDLGALQLDVRTHYQLAHGFTAGPGGFRATRTNAQVGFRTFDPEGFRLFGVVARRAQGFLQPAVLRLRARRLREISPAKIVQHGCSFSIFRPATDHARTKIGAPKCIAFSNAHARLNSRAKSCNCQTRSRRWHESVVALERRRLERVLLRGCLQWKWRVVQKRRP